MNAFNSRLAFGARMERPSHETLRNRFYLSLLLLDTCCILGSFFAAHLLYDRGNGDWFIVAAPLLPLYVVLALNARAYTVGAVDRYGLGVLRSARAFLFAAVFMIMVAFFMKASADYSRGMVAIGLTFGLASLMAGRLLLLRHARKLMGGDLYSTYLICDGIHLVDFSKFSFVIHAGTDIDPDLHCPDMYDRLATMLKHADRVVVGCPPERRALWSHLLKGLGIKAEIMAPELEQTSPMGIGSCGGRPTLVVANGALSKFDSITKRGFDVTVSGFALLFLLPAFLTIALAIRLETRGPVFFVQTRIGQGNRQFRMLKFRSMRVEQLDHSGTRSTGRDDDRITRVGRFIRATSLDELPQLLNVLLGDMSIVGPRPHALASRAADKLFWEIDGRYWHRHATKPGLTGLAQIRGYRGATEHASDLTNRLQADLEYLRDWSLFRDLWIVLQTFRVLVHKNAF
ncbi:exopolysaccharide biosynthesis polyprenyl glycosylphosphotransferase [Sphingomonas sp. R647]|uniref:exopolysaccharide biosynthesis polyprenyl glycosylphosphotransferase n=1 Tax=Sphingomonas sp. R647 TaxID=2875233 RepID=UPI001CD53B6F|nr:exopolysaccharide biosynthesis polyprenyl glycosylphosphotransferase [Sphingomonas sp. R647]MCA1196360.1 exopolysaccharide biosynthesis polyprenyl glycosylphosphotransferase [Sphingomonas sp. R647]